VTKTKAVKVCHYEKVPQTRHVKFCVVVPVKKAHTVKVCHYECVAEERSEEYCVMVPHQVEKEVQVRVCRMVPKTVTCQVPVSHCCSPSTSCCTTGH
jgi:hypothetical protein